MMSVSVRDKDKEGILRKFAKNPAIIMVIGGVIAVPVLIVVLFYIYSLSSPDTVHVYQTPEKAVAGAKVGGRMILVHNTLDVVNGTKTSLQCQNKEASQYECIWKAADGKSPARAVIRSNEKFEAEGYFSMEVKVLDKQPDQITAEFVRYVEKPDTN